MSLALARSGWAKIVLRGTAREHLLIDGPQPEPSAMTERATWSGVVGELFRYPVKSMQGERVGGLAVGPGGVVGDRALALLDLSTGHVASAHHPQKWGALLHCAARWEGDPDAGGSIVVTLPDGGEEAAGPRLERLLSDLLGRRVALIRKAPAGGAYEIVHPDIEGVAPDAFVEQTLEAAGVRHGRVGRLDLGLDAPAGALVDVSPVHLVAASSLLALQTASEPVDLRRFRPNLVFEGPGSGYVEAAWTGAHVAAGQVLLAVSMPTPRCAVTTLEQRGVPADSGPLRRLAAQNRIDMGGGGWACFGSYATVVRPGPIALGDPVTIVGPHANAR